MLLNLSNKVFLIFQKLSEKQHLRHFFFLEKWFLSNSHVVFYKMAKTFDEFRLSHNLFVTIHKYFFKRGGTPVKVKLFVWQCMTGGATQH